MVALNMAFSYLMKYSFHRLDPLHGDLTTTFVKRKVPTFGQILEQDSHRHDRVLVTSATHRGV